MIVGPDSPDHPFRQVLAERLGREVPKSPRERVEGAILDCFGDDYEPSPQDVAMLLCEEDVAAGDYEGCSSELDLAASEYMALASRALGREN